MTKRKPIYRVSTTWLDAFDRMQSGKETFPRSGVIYTPELLERHILTPPKGDKLSAGSGFHAVVPDTKGVYPMESGTYVYRCPQLNKPFRFVRQDIDRIRDELAQEIADGVWEVKRVRQFEFEGFIMEVSCVADLLFGLVCFDLKSSGNPDLTEFDNSWQWKIYLTVFRFNWFRYLIYPLRIRSFDIGIGKQIPYDRQRYDGMERDVNNILFEFGKWITTRPKVAKALKAKQKLRAIEDAHESNQTPF